MDITPYLKLLCDKNGSDLYFTAGATVKIKIEGKVQSVGRTVLSGELVSAAAQALMTGHTREMFERNWEVDFSLAPSGLPARFRVNVYRQRGDVAMVLRLIPSEIPDIDSLGLPAVLKTLAMHQRGLVLMVGATGSGKSTTLAAMVDERNRAQAGHILTIEDPIEFSHPNHQSIVSQREVGVDTHSYARALRSAMREAPDVILIGEIRDRETMEAALELCNTGHLCLSTMHASNANQAMERVLNLFPESLHKQALLDLALNLRGVVSQRLVMGTDGRRCAAIEIMLNTPHLADLILKGQIGVLKEAMDKSGVQGMQTFDESLLALYRDGRIDLEQALAHADSRTNLEARINFG